MVVVGGGGGVKEGGLGLTGEWVCGGGREKGYSRSVESHSPSKRKVLEQPVTLIAASYS